MIESLFTAKGLAAFLNMHPNSIYRLVKNGLIPYKRVPAAGIRFRSEEINKWLEQGRSAPVFKSLLNVDLSLEAYDRLFLCKKGGVKVSPKGKTWNYPFGSVILRLSRSGKERWHIYYRLEGRRIRKAVKHAQTRADALKVLQVEVADAFRGKHGFPREGKRTTFAKPNKRSWRDDQCCVGILDKYFGKAFLQEIGPHEIETFKSDRLKIGNSPARVNRYLALLKKMFNLAIDWGFTCENPVRKVRFFSERDNLKERILTPDEESRLLEHSAEHLKPIILAALNTGMRRGEILGLRCEQVDLHRRTVRLEKTKGGRVRIVPINDALYEVLAAQRRANGASPYVFPAPGSRGPLHDVKTAFNAATRRAGIKGLRFHDLRHTFASRLIEGGVDLITVKDLLGHHSVTITQRYTHSGVDQKRRAVEVLRREPSPAPQVVPAVSTRAEKRLVSSFAAVS